MKNGKVRKLKVYYAHHPRKYGKYPVIRIGGNYLNNLGFNIGDIVFVHFSDEGLITIQKKTPGDVAGCS